MPDTTVQTLCLTAASLGVVHTAMGPDHYVPFIALAKDGGWPIRRTVVVTAGCGIVHVLSSIGLGGLGVMFGSSLHSLVHIEQWRGETAGWLLLGFGIAYTVWGLRSAIRHRASDRLGSPAGLTEDAVSGSRSFGKGDSAIRGFLMSPFAQRKNERTLPAPSERQLSSPDRGLRVWVIFLIFAFGPCEPLIPLLIYPAATLNYATALMVSAVFGIATLATMLAIVVVGHRGLTRIPGHSLHRFSHALCGSAVALCGALVCLGL